MATEAERLFHRECQVVTAQHSADGETSKLLLQLQDGLTVESVIMHYDTSGAALIRLSACLQRDLRRLCRGMLS